MSKKALSRIEPLEHYLVSFRRKQVVLDTHVAKLYGVQTRDVNKAVKNNPKKFPKGYVIQLTDKELQSLRWKISTAKKSIKKPSQYCEGLIKKGGDLLFHKCSTIGANGLNCSVRDGKR